MATFRHQRPEKRSRNGIVRDAPASRAIDAVHADEAMFATYSIGLAIGFFSYFVVALLIGGKDEVRGWMGGV